MKVNAWGTKAATEALGPMQIERREVGPRDVQIEILYSGICHSDIHQARGEWGNSKFPMVPGHEIVGRVTAVGAEVKKLKVGDLAGVGCMVDSCRTCYGCGIGEEQFCEQSPAFTYNSTEMDRKTPTLGGYSTHVVVTEHFALKVPSTLDLKAAAPLLCAGITTYSPLRQWNCKPGDKVAVLGLGGLGHMAVKLAAAMGAEVTVLSSSPSKEADAKKLGAAHFASSVEKASLRTLKNHFNLIIDAVSADHSFETYLNLLAPFGALVLVGAPPKPSAVGAFSLINNNRRLAGSSIGGIRQTQEMLDFCAEKKLGADIELIAAKDINVAYERMLKNDVRYRFVIDAKTF